MVGPWQGVVHGGDGGGSSTAVNGGTTLGMLLELVHAKRPQRALESRAGTHQGSCVKGSAPGYREEGICSRLL